MNEELLSTEAKKLGLELNAEQLKAFAAFEEDLYATNQMMNLTRVPRELCWERHFLDSLLISAPIPNGAVVMDLGTGPGFPAWPLAVARPDLSVIAVDSSNKMVAFLNRHLRPNLRIESVRVEDQDWEAMCDVVTGRAFAPLAVMLEVSARACRLGGCIIPFRTPTEQEDAKAFPASRLGLELEKEVLIPLGESEIVRYFPIFRKVKPTSRVYPRTWAAMKKTPLRA